MPIITGEEYIDRINKLKSDIWIEGEQIKGNISEHKAFKGVMNSQAALYNLQHKKLLKDIMTYISPKTGKHVGTSFLIPKTKDDLFKRRTIFKNGQK